MLRTFLSIVSPVFFATLSMACPYGDIGAPCSHGAIDPLPTRRVTFPALSCNHLVCIYAEEKNDVPAEPCETDADCNIGGGTGNICELGDDATTGKCSISIDHVLEHSMCSRKCATDDDCNNTGTGKKKRPAAEETACRTGFVCTRIQRLGDLCCEPLCVCRDYYRESDANLDAECRADEIECPNNTPPPAD